MRGLGLGHDDIAAEIARRYRLRPREAYRLAQGWTQDEAAARFNARAAELGTDPDGQASMAANRLCEFEKWPDSQRRPSVYALIVLAIIYQTGVLSLLDLNDHENLPPRDRLTLLQSGQPAPASPSVLTPADTTPSSRHPGAAAPSSASGLPPVSAQGISISLACVPGRVVIEVTDPSPASGQDAAQPGDLAACAVTAREQPPGAETATCPSYGERA
jgi:hypothetical protein